MADSRDRQAVDELVADFGASVEGLKREGVPNVPSLGARTPWKEISEERKLEAIVWESWISWDGLTVPGSAALEVIERNVDYAGLASNQREMLQDLRARRDAGEIGDTLPGYLDRIGVALARIVGIGEFEERLRSAKEDEDRPWAEVPETEKVKVLVDMEQVAGAPAAYALAAIEREVDYQKLSPWRREALEGLRSRFDQGELDSDNPKPSYLEYGAGYALRLAELESRIEDDKRLGVLDGRGKRWPWQELSEEQKLDDIGVDIANLELHGVGEAYELIDRAVDMRRVPEGRRRDYEEGREQARLTTYGSRSRAAMEAFADAGLEEGFSNQADVLRSHADLLHDHAPEPPSVYHTDSEGGYNYFLDDQGRLMASPFSLYELLGGGFTFAARIPVEQFDNPPLSDQEGREIVTALRERAAERTAPSPGELVEVPDNEEPRKGTYQVWHDRGWPQSRIDQMLGGWPPSEFPAEYFHAADVRAGNLQEAVEFTTSKGHLLNGGHQPWDTNEDVRSYTPKPFVPRDTDTGDVIVDPQGRAYRVEGHGFSEVKAAEQPLPSHELVTDNREDMPTPEEWQKLKAEWTQDYGLRHMEDRGLNYEDEAEHRLDHAGTQGTGVKGHGNSVSPAGTRSQLHGNLSPSEIAEDRSEPDSPGPEHGRGRGR